jgi:hypothetical protein
MSGRTDASVGRVLRDGHQRGTRYSTLLLSVVTALSLLLPLSSCRTAARQADDAVRIAGKQHSADEIGKAAGHAKTGADALQLLDKFRCEQDPSSC